MLFWHDELIDAFAGMRLAAYPWAWHFKQTCIAPQAPVYKESLPKPFSFRLETAASSL
jgi:hypothetical protein